MPKKGGFTWFERLLRKYGDGPMEANTALTWNSWTLEKRIKLFEEIPPNTLPFFTYPKKEDVCKKYWNELNNDERIVIHEMYRGWFQIHKDDWKKEQPNKKVDSDRLKDSSKLNKKIEGEDPLLQTLDSILRLLEKDDFDIKRTVGDFDIIGLAHPEMEKQSANIRFLAHWVEKEIEKNVDIIERIKEYLKNARNVSELENVFPPDDILLLKKIFQPSYKKIW